MFEKNLQYLNNEALKRRLLRITPAESKEGISYCITPTNDYVLLKNDIPCDDLTSPRDAVKRQLAMNIKGEMKSNDIIVIFGIGLGYILDETFNKYPSKIFLYEPDVNLLHFVLNNVDMSEILASGRVFISNEVDEIVSKIEDSYINKDKVEIVYLQNYAVMKNKELLLLTQKVYDTCKSKMVDVNTINKFSKRWLLNTLNNIATINSKPVYLLSDLESKFIGQTALIAGAGPSLNDNIENIKANRSHFVIFAVNKAIKFLQENNIIPDFVVCLDAGNIDLTLPDNDAYLSQTNCIVDIRTDSATLNRPFNKVFVNFSDTDFLIKKLARFNENIKFYETGGTAATLALAAATKLGFSKIIFAGIDLAFKENVIYADGRTMERFSQEEILVDYVKKPLVQVPSVTGGMVYTRGDYQAFIHHFSTLISELNCPTIYNISSFGANIEGTKNCPFEELQLFTNGILQPINDAEPFKLDLKDFMQEEFFNINNIIELLSQGTFSPALVSSIVKSVLVYQYMQTDILNVLQKSFAPEIAEEFIDNTKQAIKSIIEVLQRNKLI